MGLIVPGIQAGIGLIGGILSSRRERDIRRRQLKERRKLISGTNELYDRQLGQAENQYRANNSGSTASIERILRSKGIEGSSAGLEAIGKAGSQNAQVLNDATANINSNRLADILKIKSSFPVNEKETFGEGAGALLGEGLKGIIDHYDEDSNSLEALLNKYSDDSDGLIGTALKNKKKKFSKEEILKLLNKNPNLRDQFQL